MKEKDFKQVRHAQLLTPEEGFALIAPGKLLGDTGYHPLPNNPVRVASLDLDQDAFMSLPELGVISDAAPVGTDSYFAEPVQEPPVPAMLLASLTDLPVPEDLGETVEVQLTPAIRAKAVELGNDPLQIYEWVKNNIEFVPTWGSIQGADYCMQAEVCNAFDTASLLIALLRAADVPARYVHGTGEMDVERFVSWVGDFSDITAALNFARSGGIPTTVIIQGGKITKARFETVWVEAWIDFSRRS